MSAFDELVELDRPFVPVKFKLGSKEIYGYARRLSAAEADNLDVAFADEYARLIIDKTESKDGRESELDRVRRTYSLRPRHEILEQVLGTRFADVQALAYEVSGVDSQQVSLEASKIEDETERKSFLKPFEDSFQEGLKQAKEQIGHEYDDRSDEELISIISQVNVNIKAMGEARALQDRMRLHYCLYSESKEPFIPSIDKVRQLQPTTITAILKVIDLAFILKVPEDLPFESPGVQEPDGQPSSPSISAEDTKAGGELTGTSANA